jgi:hypothetical protein
MGSVALLVFFDPGIAKASEIAFLGIRRHLKT